MSAFSKNITKSAWIQFREIQVMLAKHRVLTSSYLFPTMMFTEMTAQIAGLFNSLMLLRNKGGEEINLGMAFVFFWCAIVAGMIIVFFFGALAGVNESSMQVREKIKRNRELMSNKWFRMYNRSCPLLKVYINYTSFFETETPLNAENVVIDQTISLLLL